MLGKTSSRIIKLGLDNFWRNSWLSFVATIMLTLTLLIMSMFVIFNIAVSSTTEALKEKIDLAVYFNDSASEDQVLKIQQQIESRSDVKSVEFVSKQEAYQRWLALQTRDDIKSLITPQDNPLPRSLEIKTTDPDHLQGIADFMAQGQFKDMVRSISYQRNKDIIKKLINITNFSQKLGLGLSVVFISIAILVILNTIRLTIFTRRDEIEIMRLVGASDVFIRLPFLVEAIFYSLFACFISTIILGFMLYLADPFVNKYMGDIPINLPGFFWHNIGWIIFGQLFVGIFVTFVCNLISVRKHLKV